MLAAAIAVCMSCTATTQLTPQEQLAKAIDYFQGGKYHEALLLFRKLGSGYRLNPRFMAYMGVCHFYDGNYKEAVEIFGQTMESLNAFAPHERSVYYYCDAESCFRIGRYQEAICLFEKQSMVCYDNEKGDALFRIGLCYASLGNIENAQEYMSSAVAYYRKYNDEYKLKEVEREIGRLYGK